MNRVSFVRAVARCPLRVPAAILLIAAPLFGEDVDVPTGRADTVHVPAALSGMAEDIDRLPYSTSVRDLTEANERLLTIGEVLDETAGVRVRRYGAIGSFATASIRGSSPGQVEVYLDGIPLGNAQWGRDENLAEIPIDNLASVQVFRSSAPVYLGTPGIGGAINLVSRPAGGRRTTLSLSAGSYGTWKTGVVHSGSIGGFDHMISFRRLRSDGDLLLRLRSRNARAERKRRPREDEGEQPVPREQPARQARHPRRERLAAPHPGRVVSQGRGLTGSRQPRVRIGFFRQPPAHVDARRGVARILGPPPALRPDRLLPLSAEPLLQPGKRAGAEPERSHPPLDRGRVQRASHLLLARDRSGDLPSRGPEKRRLHAGGGIAVRHHHTGFERKREYTTLAVEDRISFSRDRVSLLLAWRDQEANDNFFGPVPFGRPPEARSKEHKTVFRGPTFGIRTSAGSLVHDSRESDGVRALPDPSRALRHERRHQRQPGARARDRNHVGPPVSTSDSRK